MTAPVDPGRWPDVAAVPRGRAGTNAAGLLMPALLRRLPLRVAYPDGRVTGTLGPTMTVLRPRDLWARVAAGGAIGFGEAYQAGDWDSDDLAAVLTVVATGLTRLLAPVQSVLWRLRATRPPRAEANTPDGARRNIERHYDLSNELFALFLDRSMTYSSALFERLDEDLTAAQHRKIDRILDVTAVRAGSRVLEIGTGWGELAIRAARRGAHVVSVTLSEQQRKLALRRSAEAGVADRVEVRRCDYRSVEPVPGGFDAVVSVEMVEAVGREYWPVFARAVLGHLRPGGRAGVQLIAVTRPGMAEDDSYTWVQKYVFPGGLVPSVPAIAAAFTAAGGHVEDRFDFGPRHYAETLRRWRASFLARRDDVRALGFDETFVRTWDFYLAFCEAGFAAGYLDCGQLVVTA